MEDKLNLTFGLTGEGIKNLRNSTKDKNNEKKLKLLEETKEEKLKLSSLVKLPIKLPNIDIR